MSRVKHRANARKYGRKHPKPYMLYVSGVSEVSGLQTFETSQANLNLFDATPFDGLAIREWPTDWENLDFSWVDGLESSKHLWPYIRTTIMTASNGFIDLDDAEGRITLLCQQLTNALNTALALGAPGIFIDFEFYTGNGGQHSMYAIESVLPIAHELLVPKVQAIGARLADTIIAAFPNAVIWTAFASLNVEEAPWTYYYLSNGLLNRAKSLNAAFTYVDGGEAVGYIYPSLENFKARVWGHKAKMAPVLNVSPTVKTGWPQTWWASTSETGSWVASTILQVETDTGAPIVFQGLPDWGELLKFTLLQGDYMWLYNPGYTGLRPLGKDFEGVSALLDQCCP